MENYQSYYQCGFQNLMLLSLSIVGIIRLNEK